MENERENKEEQMEKNFVNTQIEEKVLKPANGMAMMLILILVMLICVGAIVWGAMAARAAGRAENHQSE